MKKLILTTILLLIISCNTTKHIQEEKKVDKIEDITSTKVNTNSETNVVKDVVTDNKDEEYQYEPIDETKPMVIGGITYHNVKINKIKRDTKSTIKELSKENKSQTINQDTKFNKTQISEGRVLDKKTTHYSWLWLIFLVVLIVIIRKYFL